MDWQDEGYAEFIAYDKSIRFQEVIAELRSLKESTSARDRMRYEYQGYRVAVAYLMIEKGCSLGQILSREESFEDILNEACLNAGKH